MTIIKEAKFAIVKARGSIFRGQLRIFHIKRLQSLKFYFHETPDQIKL